MSSRQGKWLFDCHCLNWDRILSPMVVIMQPAYKCNQHLKYPTSTWHVFFAFCICCDGIFFVEIHNIDLYTFKGRDEFQIVKISDSDKNFHQGRDRKLLQQINCWLWPWHYFLIYKNNLLQISAFFLFSNFRKRQIALYSPGWSVGWLVGWRHH